MGPYAQLQKLRPEAIASFDIEPWLPWNYARRKREEKAKKQVITALEKKPVGN